MRAISMPALIIFRRTVSDELAGPTVQMIFVLGMYRLVINKPCQTQDNSQAPKRPPSPFSTSFIYQQSSLSSRAKGIYQEINLNDDVERELKKLNMRLLKLHTNTISNMKNYFRDMWIINKEMEERAIMETTKLANDPMVKENISNFVNFNKFPWDN